MPLGSRLQTEITAWQMTECALYLFLHMRRDAALRGRVDGENASIGTAFDVPIHSAGTFVNGLLEDFGFPAVQEGCVEPVASGISVGEHKRLPGVKGLLREGVELGCVPVDLDLDSGKGYRVLGICAFSVGCEGDVGFVIMGVKILSVPAAREGNLGPESAGTRESRKGVMTRGLSQRIETQESFVRGGVRFIASS